MEEFGQLQRHAQFEAARALLFCDSDGGQERLFRRRRVGGVLFQQDFAPRAMQFRFEGAVTGPLGGRQRVVEDGHGAAWITGLGLLSRQGYFYQTVKNMDVLYTQVVYATAHAVESTEQVALDPRPSIEKHSEGAELWEIVRAGDSSKLQRICLPPHEVAMHQLKLGGEHVSEGDRVAMRE